MRIIFMGSAPLSCESLHALRQRAGISRDVVILGLLDQIEIWDKARWEEKVRSAPPAEELTAKMGELGV